MAVGYDSTGIVVDSWGLIGHVTWAALAKYMTAAAGGELYAVISSLEAVNDKAPNGFDFEALKADFKEIVNLEDAIRLLVEYDWQCCCRTERNPDFDDPVPCDADGYSNPSAIGHVLHALKDRGVHIPTIDEVYGITEAIRQAKDEEDQRG